MASGLENVLNLNFGWWFHITESILKTTELHTLNFMVSELSLSKDVNTHL